jgi:Family of unknown function (DUF5989)
LAAAAVGLIMRRNRRATRGPDGVNMSEDLKNAKPPVDDLESQLPSKPPGLVKEFFIFLRDYKLWWITPIVFVLLTLSLFIFFTEGSAVLPFIYAVF